MKSKIFFQMNEMDTISSKITENFEKSPKKVYIFSGTFKESGFKIIEENFIDSKAKIYLAIGIDKKNTTKSMLDSLLSYTKNIYFYNNNELVEFDSSVCIFEYTNEALMYNLSSNISEGGLLNDNAIYIETVYDLKDTQDKKEYKEMLKTIISKVEDENGKFTKLTKSLVEELQNNKEIFTTKQYVHNVKSISDLLGKEPIVKEEKKEMTKDEIDDIYVSNIEIPKIEIDDDLGLDDIDISAVEKEPVVKTELKEKKENKKEINKKSIKEEENVEVEEIDEENEFYDEELDENDFDEDGTLDIASMLFSKADLKLDIDNAKKEQEKKEKQEEVDELNTEDEIVKVKKVNLNNVSNFIYELPSKTPKSQDVIKIPNYISKMVPNFFELSENGNTVEKDGVVYKIRKINLELVDVKTGSKYTDREAMISYKPGQSYVQIISNTFKNIQYIECDIARIIKLDSKVYHIEIIPQDMQEYKLWSKVCNQVFKSSKRKYGMM